MKPSTGAGITVELMGYGTAITCHLKLHWLPFIEVYVPIKDDECVIQELSNFTSSSDDKTVIASLIKNLLQSKGDNYAYANITACTAAFGAANMVRFRRWLRWIHDGE